MASRCGSCRSSPARARVRHLKVAVGREFGDVLGALKQCAGRDVAGGPADWERYFVSGDASGGVGQAVETVADPTTTFYGIPSYSKRHAQN